MYLWRLKSHDLPSAGWRPRQAEKQGKQVSFPVQRQEQTGSQNMEFFLPLTALSRLQWSG